MRRRVIPVLTLGIAVALAVYIRSVPSLSPAPPRPRYVPPLDRHVGTLDFDDVALDKVLEQLSARCRVTIVWDKGPQDPNDGFSDLLTSVRVQATDCTLGQAIDKISAAAFGRRDTLVAQERDGTVRVGLLSHSDLLETRMYDVGDFIDRFLVPGRAGGRPPTGARFISVPILRLLSPVGTTPESDYLIDVIVDLIKPDVWKVSSERPPSMEVVGGLLIATQPRTKHREIQNLLANLRSIRADIDRGLPPRDIGIDPLRSPPVPTP